ncbi:MAG: glycosyltransferase [Kofleriaceae bacterium]
MTAPLRILHVFGAMNRGGAELRTLSVMREVDRSRFALEFCALSGEAGSLTPVIEELGGRVTPCKLDVGFAPRFVRLVRARHIDIVHSHVHLASGYILALARLAGVPHRIAHFRSTGDERGDTPARAVYRRAMWALVDHNATAIAAVSAGCLDAAWGAAWHRDPRCRVIYAGVEPRRFAVDDAAASIRAELGMPADARVVVQVARFDDPKNQPLAVDAIAGVPGAHLVFVGRGGTPLENATRAAVARHGVTDRVHFVGERADVARWLVGADLALLTSTREGLPGVVLEAVAAGTPVVASRLPGTVETAALLPGIVLRAVDDPPAAWAEAIAAALAAPRRQAELRAAFLRSPFTRAASAAAHVALWTGQPAP